MEIWGLQVVDRKGFEKILPLNYDIILLLQAVYPSLFHLIYIPETYPVSGLIVKTTFASPGPDIVIKQSATIKEPAG